MESIGECQRVSKSIGENWVKYAIIRYKANNNSTLSENIHNTVDKDDSWVTNGKYEHMSKVVGDDRNH